MIESAEFSPVRVSSDIEVWQRENQFTDLQNSIRYGWGPELSDQFERKTHPEEKVIVLVGDSFVWGKGVEDSDMRWDKRLEQVLNREGMYKYRVVPLARLMASTMEESEWLSAERLSRIKPDAIVVGFISNDPVPSYAESRYCAQFDICVEDGEMPAVGNPRNTPLVACLLGNESLFGKFVRNVVITRFPNIGRWMVKRWCDPDRLDSISNLLRQGEGIIKPANTPSWPYFVESLESMKRAAGDTPIFMAETGISDLRLDSSSDGRDAFRNSGFSIIPMSNTNELLAGMPESSLLHINPSDNHPGSRLTMSYAVDTAKALLEKIESDEEITGSNLIMRDSPIISNYLPVSLAVGEASSEMMVFAYTGLNEEQRSRFGLSSGRGGAVLPPQLVPCARMGRPHVRVMLNSAFISDDPIKLNLEISARALVVQPIGYKPDGSTISSNEFVMQPGQIATLSLEPGITGFLIGVTEEGCPNDEISMPIFRMRISR